MRNQSKIIRFLQSKGVIYDNLTSHTKEKIGQMTDNPVVGNILGILEGGKKSGKQASDYKKIISLFENEMIFQILKLNSLLCIHRQIKSLS